MLTKQTYKLTALAIAASLVLAACGGGGGGSNASTATGASAPTAASTPTVTSGVAPQTSVAAATYAAGSFQAAAFQLVNSYRLAMGVGELSQDPILDTSGQPQADYLFDNISSGAITALSHDEIAGFTGYYGDTPLSRAQKAGAPTTEWIAENIADGHPQGSDAANAADCIGQALASVYHLSALTSNQQTVGYGYNPGTAAFPIYTCASEFGTSTGVVGAPGTNSLSYVGGQQIPTGSILHSPVTSEAGVALTMAAESPNPAPDFTAPGRPILVRVNASNMDTLTVSQFTLTDNTGATVAARILVPATAQASSTATTVADPNSILPNGVAVLLPQVALKPSTTYTVTFAGARDGSALSTKWSFTTAAS